MEIAVTLFFILILLLVKGFFSGSEIALVNADKVKLQHRAKQGDKGAKMVLDAFKRPDELLSITLVGTNISTIALTSIATVLMISLVGQKGDLVAFLVFTPLLLILGEIVPKSVMQQMADKVTTTIIYPLRWFGVPFYPVIFVFSRVARFAARLAGASSSDKGLFMTREQLSAVVEMAEKSSKLSAFDRGQIRKVMRFAQITAGEAMIPMAEVTAINKNKTLKEAAALTHRYGYERLPVYADVASNVTGIATITQWDMMDPAISKKKLKDFTGDTMFVSPLQTVDELIPLISTRKDRVAIVVDEYGSAIGMITMEDIMSQVVGAIDMMSPREHDERRHTRVFEDLGQNAYLIDARYPVSEVNELIGGNLPMAEFHTLGGLILGRLRHIPKEGESMSDGGFRFTVMEANERAIQIVKVEPA